MRFLSILVALVSAAVAFNALRPTGPAPAFVPVADGLFRLTQWWQPVPGLLRIPVSVFLVHQDNSSNWALIDAGFPDSRRQAHATHLLAAVKSTIPEGDKLAAIALTHAHPDHIGALPLLLEAFPQTPVVLHELEAPFLVEQAEGSAAQGGDAAGAAQYFVPGSLLARALTWAGMISEQPIQVPAARAQLLTDPVGSLYELGMEDLLHIVSLGHTPGHITFLHSTSRAALVGDSLSFMRPSLALLHAPDEAQDGRVVAAAKPLSWLPGLALRAELNIICPQHCDAERAAFAACLLPGAFQFVDMFASHDWALARAGNPGGWTSSKLYRWTEASTMCQEQQRKLQEQAAAHPEGGQGDEGEFAVEEETDDEYGGWEEEEQEAGSAAEAAHLDALDEPDQGGAGEA